jgi:general secretion pathway protein N
MLMEAAIVDRLKRSGSLGTSYRQEKMLWSPKTIRLALLSGLILTVGWVPAPRAATSATLDILPSDVAGTSIDRVEVGTLKPLAGLNQEAGKRPPSGNPLWSIPLAVMSATQQRPIFSASRRPPPAAVIGPRIEPPNVPAVEKPAEHPSLALIGAVVGDSDAIAVFLDRANNGIVRLRQGEAHAGWVLSSILRREVTVKKGDQTEVLALQRPNVSPGSFETFGVPVLPTQTSGNTSTPYAPFIPRNTPKNGEPDGL